MKNDPKPLAACAHFKNVLPTMTPEEIAEKTKILQAEISGLGEATLVVCDECYHRIVGAQPLISMGYDVEELPKA